MLQPLKHRYRSGHSLWPMIAFLACFTVLLIVVCYVYLFPAALQAMKGASDEEKRKLKAWAALLESLLLFILFAGLVLTVKFGRFFFPGPDTVRTKTKHIDAWAEAGKRLEVDKSAEDDSSPDSE